MTEIIGNQRWFFIYNLRRRFGTMKKLDSKLAQEKMIMDSNTGNPVKEIIVEGDRILIIRENGEKIEIPSSTVRGKHILMRIEHGISEITEPIYV
jgi:hypothetical protein